MPHGHCFLWKQDILWTHIISDSIIAISYYSIPAGLYVITRKRSDLAFNWMFTLFAIFIFACGTTHIMGIWNLWHGHYRIEGLIKAITALASLATAFILWPLIPHILKIPSHHQLKQTNNELNFQIMQRIDAEAETQKLNIELEERVNQRTRELQLSNADLKQFAYIASHDLKQPLRTISNMVQLLEKRLAGQLDAQSTEYIGLTKQGADRMQQLIDDLLSYSRIGRVEEDSVSDSEQVLTEVIRIINNSIEAGHTTIIRQGIFGKVPVAISQLSQVLQNLIDNAIKYRSNRDPVITITGVIEEGLQRIEIADNGIGIEPQYYERIFEMFKRLHHEREYPGTGIGLAICKKIIERHAGQISLESEVGKGSVFTITLPSLS